MSFRAVVLKLSQWCLLIFFTCTELFYLINLKCLVLSELMFIRALLCSLLWSLSICPPKITCLEHIFTPPNPIWLILHRKSVFTKDYAVTLNQVCRCKFKVVTIIWKHLVQLYIFFLWPNLAHTYSTAFSQLMCSDLKWSLKVKVILDHLKIFYRIYSTLVRIIWLILNNN